MDSSPSDLTLDYTPNGNGNGGGGGGHPMTPKQAPLVVEQHHLTAAEQASATTTVQKLQEFLSRLDDERLKIDAFKRELPLCMQLLNQAMEAYRQQLEACQMGSSHGGTAGPGRAPLVLEEFIPLSKNIDAADQNQQAASENPKASWMVSAQLWNGPPPSSADAPQTPKERSEHPPLDAGTRGNGGAFLPFTKEMITTTADHSPAALLPELALAPGAEKDALVGINNGLSASGDKKPYLHHDAGGGGNNGLAVARRDDDVLQNGSQTTTAAAAPQTNRKARRCWSPELHRRFVAALQRLGGPQVATPKQIREMMKVDGLTNDEVKSHLQKYRLHTRRASSSDGDHQHQQQSAAVWPPSEQPQYTASQHSTSKSGGSPMQLTGSSRATAGDSCDGEEEEEDGRSASYGWGMQLNGTMASSSS